jgi:ankyrin repeat protein
MLLEYGEDVIGFLYSCGADIGAQDLEGNTPLHIAAASAHHADSLAHDLTSTPSRPDAACVRFLLQSGADIKALNRAGMTPAHFAAANGSVAALQLLVDYGADLSLRDAAGKFSVVVLCFCKRCFPFFHRCLLAHACV